MNPVLVLTHNNLSLTQKCVDSIDQQDIDTWVHAVDNDSTDYTWQWLKDHTIAPVQFSPQIGVSGGWNTGLKWLFESEDAEHVLVVNNDVILATFFYRELLAYNLPFVSGRETTNLADLDKPFEQGSLGGGPQFSAFLIQKSAWNTIGEFDTAMVSWASDIDYHLRAHRLGTELHSAPVIYYHERSSTINKANPREKRALEMQADGDRLAFAEKWGFAVGSPEHHAAFSPEFFGIDVNK